MEKKQTKIENNRMEKKKIENRLKARINLENIGGEYKNRKQNNRK